MWFGDSIVVKLTFIPGELHLFEELGTYVVRAKNREILRTKSKREATTVFNEFRKQMEQEFPNHDLTSEEKRALLEKAIVDSIIDRSAIRKKKKSTARSTRTFG